MGRRHRIPGLSLLVLLLAAGSDGPAQPSAAVLAPGINPELLATRWSARWIYPPDAAPFDFGVFHFRRTFELAGRPRRFVVHVSGDNRYQLFANGARVVWGPARGDLNHWRYESVDVAPYLRAGKNVLAAVVWNFAEHAPESQVTNRTAFLLQGDTAAERVADTGPSWKCRRNEAYLPIPLTHDEMRGYYVVGPGERVDGARFPWGWETPDFDDSAWPAAKTDGRSHGSPRTIRDAGNRWMLVPRSIPLMEESPQRLQSVRRAEAVAVPAGFPASQGTVQFLARTKARLLLDQSHLTTAYPEIIVSGGKGALITLRYAEALFQKGEGAGKGNRNDVEGKEFVGNRDEWIADGAARRLLRPLWWRTYRYLELTVETAAEPLLLEDLRGVYTGYPFKRRSRLSADSGVLERILDVGWRTARLCAHETYMDCPYYEQLQYAGDTRIQALVSLYNAGDDRLVRNALEQLDDSRTAEGATMSRAPTRQQQYIPGFSLWWIGMVHDYRMYRDDAEFVRRLLPGVRAVLGFFASLQGTGGSLRPLPWWGYVDWTPEWPSGVPPAEADGSTALNDLQLLLAYGWAADLEEELGSRARAAEYRQAASELRSGIHRLYWDSARGLFADTPARKSFSQQANVLAVLGDAITGSEAASLLERVLSDRSLVKCSYYFRHYLHSALNKAGLGDRYLDLLADWRRMLDSGLTTWAEIPEEAGRHSRSDCHAWSSSPNFELFRTVLGIDSAAPGFRRVSIRPFPGSLTSISGSIPHPLGEISVRLAVKEGKLEADIELPEGVTGEILWRGTLLPLRGGRSKVQL